MTTPTTFSLNVHAAWACRRSGACCTAGWNIPVEERIRPLLGGQWLLPDADGACPQFDRPSGLCRVQRDYGELMLPESCRHFPRRALIDDRGVSVALSLFCPTAAAMLVESDAPLDIVEQPIAFPASRGYDGLDARGDWPPLLRPDVLFDVDSFAAWERFLVRTLGNSPDDVDVTLARVAATGERLRAWRATAATLFEWTTRVIGEAPAMDDGLASRYMPFTGSAAFVRAAALVPAELSSPRLPDNFEVDEARLVAPAWQASAPLVLRYVGAKAFGSWTAYQSRGIRAQLAELHLAAAVLRVECVRACQVRRSVLDRGALVQAVRAADLLLVHLADRDALAAWIGKLDTDAPR